MCTYTYSYIYIYIQMHAWFIHHMNYCTSSSTGIQYTNANTRENTIHAHASALACVCMKTSYVHTYTFLTCHKSYQNSDTVRAWTRYIYTHTYIYTYMHSMSQTVWRSGANGGGILWTMILRCAVHVHTHIWMYMHMLNCTLMKERHTQCRDRVVVFLTYLSHMKRHTHTRIMSMVGHYNRCVVVILACRSRITHTRVWSVWRDIYTEGLARCLVVMRTRAKRIQERIFIEHTAVWCEHAKHQGPSWDGDSDFLRL